MRALASPDPEHSFALAVDALRVLPESTAQRSTRTWTRLEVDLTIHGRGTTTAALLVRAWRIGQLRAIAPSLADQGRWTLAVDVPPEILGSGKHGIDLEVWFDDGVTRQGLLLAPLGRIVFGGVRTRRSTCFESSATWHRRPDG